MTSTFPYPGGKERYAEWIIENLPPHKCYVEVFGGSGSVLYNKPESQTEIYNDVDDDLVQFFRVLRESEAELLEWLDRVPYSRSLYEEWATEYYNGEREDDPIERAGRYYTLRFMNFGGKISSKAGFKARNKWSPARTFNNARNRLDDVAERFNEVIIENLDWRDVLDNYDDDYVVFYLDPPYLDREDYYQTGGFDHAEFVEALDGLEAEWLVSYDRLPDGLDGYVLEGEGKHRLSQGHGGAGEDSEKLVCSFDPSETARFVESGAEQARLGEAF